MSTRNSSNEAKATAADTNTADDNATATVSDTLETIATALTPDTEAAQAPVHKQTEYKPFTW